VLISKTVRPSNLATAFWLIENQEAEGKEILTIGLEGGKEVLPLFSFEEEARLFLLLRGLSKGWQIRETTGGKLISVLFGQHANVEWVALDPIPEIGGEVLVGIVSLRRENFVELLTLESSVYKNLPHK
jgi:hypothetical protein